MNFVRTSQDVYHQILWDPRFVASQYHLGVATRHGAMKEVPLTGFVPGGDIPWHRVRYFRGPEGIVWDRSRSLDILVPPSLQGGRESPNWPLKMGVWNVSLGRHGVGQIDLVAGHLLTSEADLWALLEVNSELLGRLPADFQVYRLGEVALVSRWPALHWESFWVSEGKPAVLADFAGFRVVVTHLTSNIRGSARDKRANQWQAIREHLGHLPWLVVGDLNAADDEVALWGQDLTSKEPSFPASRSRHQRVVGSAHWLAGSRQVLEQAGSDHLPLHVDLELAESTTTHLAWAILPPRDLWPQIQAIRAQHDPAYQVWPPHINLVFPAPARYDYDSLSLLLAEVERFEVGLTSLSRFVHPKTQTLYWKVEAPQLLELRRRLGALDDEFCAHLTLAKARELPSVALKPCRFQVTALTHLRRVDGKMKVEQVIPLLPPDRQWRQFCKHCQGTPIVVGSRLWGTDSDLDLVAFGPQEFVGGRWVGSVWREADLDVMLDNWQAVRDRNALWTRVEDHQQFALRVQNWWNWLRARCLPGQSWGLPGGLAWMVLLLDHEEQALRAGDWSSAPSPAPPHTDLLAHMPPEAWRLLRQELSLQEPFRPSGLRLLGPDLGRGLGLWLDLERQLKRQVRPWKDATGFGIAFSGSTEPVEGWLQKHYPDWQFAPA